MASDRKLIEFWGKKRRNTSRIWDYFGFYEDDEKKILKNEAICKICKVGLKYTGSTSNLLYHVSSCHPEKKFTGEGEHEPSKQTTLFAYQVKKPYSFESAQAQKLHLKVTEFIVEQLLPMSIVEKPAFKELVEALDPQYKVLSRASLMRTFIPKMYEETRGKILSDLKDLSGAGVTTDGWTSLATQGYVTVTLHFIDKEWNLKSIVLETKELKGSHTAEHLKDALLCTFNDWNLSDVHITGE